MSIPWSLVELLPNQWSAGHFNATIGTAHAHYHFTRMWGSNVTTYLVFSYSHFLFTTQLLGS